MTHYLKYCIQGCRNQGGRPQQEAISTSLSAGSVDAKGEPHVVQFCTQSIHKLYWGDLGATVTDWGLSEVSQAEKDTYYTTITSTWNLKNNTNEFIHRTEIEPQTQKNKLMINKVGKGWEGGIN